MTETEIKDLIKKVTVKIEVSIGDKIEKGTGVLLQQNEKTYVLTVHHCIYGKEKPFHNTQVDNITLTLEQNICSNNVKLIAINTFKENIVLLEIENLALKDVKYLCLDRVYDEKKYFIRGYPNALNGEPHNFTANCNDSDIETIGFCITLNSLTDDTSGESAKNYMSGLSGSGVFFSENNQLYLVGLVNSLGNENGVFNRINCLKLIDLHYTDINITNFYTINEISSKLKEINKTISYEVCEEYQNNHTNFYSNLNRKHSNIHHSNEIIDKNFKSIQNYLQGKNTISEIKLLDTSFENYLVTFIDETLDYIETCTTKYISSKKEGRENLTTIRTKVLESIKFDIKLIKQELYISSKLQEYIVVGWLLNCNVDFILEDS